MKLDTTVKRVLWLMFPSYNEKENLIKLIPKLCNSLENKIADYKILIINDGSTDSTKNIISCFNKPFPIEVISHERNKGIGEVFKTGFSAIRRVSTERDLLIVLEADGTSDYTLIPELVKRLEKESDIVIASRCIKGGGYENFPLKRYLISFIGNAILRIIFRNRNIRDYTIFFRGYKIKLIKEALAIYKNKFITSKTFLANTEILVNLAKLTSNISEIPFVYRYELKIGKSKMPLFKTLFDYLKFITIKLFHSSR